MPWKPDNPLIPNNLSPETQIKPVMYFFALEYFRSFSPFFSPPKERKVFTSLGFVVRDRMQMEKNFRKKIDKKSP
jgi:hypothetical protein